MISEAIIGVALDKALDFLVSVASDIATNKIEERGRKKVDLARVVRGSSSNLRGTLQAHQDMIGRWCKVIKFFELPEQRDLRSVYVSLDTYLVPAKIHQSQREKQNRKNLRQVISAVHGHVAILGQPGAGKTTSIQKIVSEYMDGGKVLGNFQFPIVLRLREIVAPPDGSLVGPLINEISKVLPLNLGIVEADLNKERVSVGLSKVRIAEKAYIELLNSLRVAILLDGFDEAPRCFVWNTTSHLEVTGANG